MPPYKDVKTLTSLCISVINGFIIDCTTLILHKYGCYKSLHSQKHLHDVQEYLLNILHPGFLDDLLRTFVLNPGADDGQKCLILAIFMHPGMKFMHPKFSLPIKDDFYITYLQRLSKLISLDLSMVCTDEILEVVGNCCPNLECIHIVSKVDCASSKSRVGLNALRLNFFISDRGLEYLHKCRNLKRIFMNKMLRSNCGGRKTSHCGIRKLLMNLSKLEYINYQDMGLVVERLENVDSLKLVQLQDNHATPGHIDLFAQLCPNLRGLALRVPPLDHGMAQKCMDRLNESPLNIRSLDLMYFPFNKSMKNFLLLKGEAITTLSLFHSFDITTESIIYIGRYCLNMKCLHIHFLKEEEYCELDYTEIKQNNYFKYLENFNLAGTSWNPYIIFPLCLSNAKGLKVLKLYNKDYRKTVDTDILFLLSKNPLSELQNVSLFEGFIMSFITLNKFIMSCKNLISLTLIEQEGIQQFIDQFNSLHNFDIEVNLTK